MTQITTQSPWQSIPWWILMILDAVVIALTSCIDQGIGDAATMTIVINTMMGVQMFLNCNNSGLKGAMMLAPGQRVVTVPLNEKSDEDIMISTMEK